MVCDILSLQYLKGVFARLIRRIMCYKYIYIYLYWQKMKHIVLFCIWWEKCIQIKQTKKMEDRWDKSKQGRGVHCPLKRSENWNDLSGVKAGSPITQQSHRTQCQQMTENVKINWGATQTRAESGADNNGETAPGGAEYEQLRLKRIRPGQLWNSRLVFCCSVKGVWLTPWVRFRCFAIRQRPTPSPGLFSVSFRFVF